MKQFHFTPFVIILLFSLFISCNDDNILEVPEEQETTQSEIVISHVPDLFEGSVSGLVLKFEERSIDISLIFGNTITIDYR